MRVSKYIHSCLLLEENGERLLLDPGTFTLLEKKVTLDVFDGVRSILVTHAHPDHMDPDLIRRIVERNENKASVFANAEIVGKLKEKGVEATEFGSGTRKLGAFEVRATAAPHEAILSSALPANTAYLVNDRLLHPGDSYAAALRSFRGVPLFALPITAPWTTEVNTAAFADDLAPKRILPIHDGYVKEFFLKSRHEALGKHFEGRGIQYAAADEPGTSVEV
jgi:L-ascorbate metabolism protein UlaG (beta-lactamase superfamily)